MIKSLKKLFTGSRPLSSDKLSQVDEYLKNAEGFLKENAYEAAITECLKCIKLLKDGETQTLEVAKVYKNLGVIYRDLGFYQDSLVSFEKGLKITKHKNLKMHPYRGEILLDIAQTYLKEDRFYEAIESLKEAEQIFLKAEPRDEASLCTVYVKLGEALSGLDRFKEAYEYLDKGIGLVDSAEQKGKELISSVKCTMAKVSYRKGDNEKAIEYLEKVITDQEDFNFDSRVFSQIYQEISSVYIYMEKLEIAEKRLAKTLDVQQKFFGKHGHVELAQTHLHFAMLYYLDKKFTKALASCHEAITSIEKTYGSHHYLLGVAYRYQGLIYGGMQKYEEALVACHKALSIFKSLYGENHYHLASIYQDIAELYESMKDLRKASKEMKKSLTNLKNWYDSSNPRIIECYLKLVRIYTTREDSFKAEKHFKLAIQAILQLVKSKENDMFETIPFSGLLELLNNKKGFFKIATTFKTKLAKIKEEIDHDVELKKSLSHQWKEIDRKSVV